MKTLILHGHLGKEFGKQFRFDVKSVGEAIQALEANFPGKFFSAIRNNWYQIRKADKSPILEQELGMQTSSSIIHIIPVVQGAKGGKGFITAVLGVALIATAVVLSGGTAAGLAGTAFSAFGSSVTFGQVALYGVGLALSGVSQLLSPTPKLGQSNYTNRERPEERASFLFNGPVNNTEQGGPVPVVYGRVRVGSIVISGGLEVERI